MIAIVLIVVVVIGGGTNDCGDDNGGSGSIAAGSNGEWTQKGTTAYNTAKGIFDGWVKQGCSGAAAAGVVGYIMGEGNVNIPDQAERPFTGDPSGQISKGSIPNKADAGGGGGPYQITPFDGYAPVGSSKWLDVVGQTAYMVTVKKVTTSGWRPSMGVGVHPSSFKEFAHYKDPVKACDAWNCAEIGVPNNMQMREQSAKKAYEMFGGANIEADDSRLGNAAAGGNAGAAAQAADDDACYDADAEGSDSMVKIAKSLEGYFTYAFSRPVLQNTMKNPNSHDLKDVNKGGTTDCSGFVYLVTYLAGYNVPDGGWFTGSMYSDATGPHKYLRQVDEKSAKAGDIVICGGPNSAGAAGHTAILAEDWHGDQTKIINEGGAGGDGPVNEGPFITNFGSALGHNQRIFAEPVSKAKSNNK